MKWSFVIQQKIKAAILLAGIMGLIILGSFLSRQNMQGVNDSVSSIYRDRLVPATAIIYLTENLYGKRLALEKHLFSPDVNSQAEVDLLLERYDHRIDSLIRIFEQTYLVDQESKSLNDFKERVGKYISLEKRILDLSNAGDTEVGKVMFSKTAALTFDSAIRNLNELTSIQSDIGKNLMQESKSDMASFGIISLMQIGLVIIIGLMVMALVRGDQIINKTEVSGEKNQFFNLN